MEVLWCASPTWRAAASPAGAEKIFLLFSLFEWFSPIRRLLRTEELLGRWSLVCFLPAYGKERRETPTDHPGTRLRLSREDTYLGGSLLLPWAGGLCCWPAPRSPRRPPAGRRSRQAEPGHPHPGAMLRCSSQRSQSQPAEEDQPMLARFPKASRHQGVEAAFWLPQAWSTVNNMPAVSADKPSLMRLQQKHSNMHYRTSVGIFSRACF